MQTGSSTLALHLPASISSRKLSFVDCILHEMAAARIQSFTTEMVMNGMAHTDMLAFGHPSTLHHQLHSPHRLLSPTHTTPSRKAKQHARFRTQGWPPLPGPQCSRLRLGCRQDWRQEGRNVPSRAGQIHQLSGQRAPCSSGLRFILQEPSLTCFLPFHAAH